MTTLIVPHASYNCQTTVNNHFPASLPPAGPLRFLASRHADWHDGSDVKKSRKPRSESPPTATRTRILKEASRLFNERGYHGAGTREIAAAVGVRQQSLSHHFPTKRAILEELLAETLNEPLRVVRVMVAADGSPAARLYAYIRFDVAHLQESPYVLQGLFGTYLLKDPELVKWYDGASDLYDAVAAIVAEGVAAGEFRDVDPDVAAAAVGALVEQAFSVWGVYGIEPTVPGWVADFCLRALLRDPATLDQVREVASTLDITCPVTP